MDLRKPEDRKRTVRTKWKAHGTVQRYRQGGCADIIGGEPGTGEHCRPCKAAMNLYQREWKAGVHRREKDAVPIFSDRDEVLEYRLAREKRLRVVSDTEQQAATYTGAAVTQPQSETESESDPRMMGSVESGVIAQTREYVDERPGDVAMAIVAAKILDTPERVAIHPQTMRQLQSILASLNAGKRKKSRGRLAAVQAMTNKTGKPVK